VKKQKRELHELEVMEAIRGRRSIRSYLNKPVPEEIIDKIMEAARLAPSASNVQSWRFKVVTEKGIRELLREAAFNQKFVEDAPVVVVACTDLGVYGERTAITVKLVRTETVKANLSALLCLVGSQNLEDEIRCISNAIVNVSIAVEHMVLVAASLGLGTCWVRAFDPEMVSRILNLPPECPPLILLPLGYPGEDPEARPRKTIDNILL
jgi:nitroreductase